MCTQHQQQRRSAMHVASHQVQFRASASVEGCKEPKIWCRHESKQKCCSISLASFGIRHSSDVVFDLTIIYYYDPDQYARGDLEIHRNRKSHTINHININFAYLPKHRKHYGSPEPQYLGRTMQRKEWHTIQTFRFISEIVTVMPYANNPA